ncbi:MAG: D-tyrosyl-tRNA(Tyr) deacylase [Nitrospirae bacterium]|nr:MAG: D-tyrosyl-tRNA(Tyr) deacylase [Nitrospirota bacterium]
MKAVIQRVARASVEVEGKIVGQIRGGLVVLLGVARGDTETDASYLVKKIPALRIFDDENGKMNRSLAEIGGGVLAISQFTLVGDTRKGRRPGFDQAADPPVAQHLYEHFIRQLRETTDLTVETGVFGARMKVELLNDGPVTFILDSQGQ